MGMIVISIIPLYGIKAGSHIPLLEGLLQMVASEKGEELTSTPWIKEEHDAPRK
jgi:hypothetical protein